MTKVEREVVFNSENGQKEMTGVRHSGKGRQTP